MLEENKIGREYKVIFLCSQITFLFLFNSKSDENSWRQSQREPHLEFEDPVIINRQWQSVSRLKGLTSTYLQYVFVIEIPQCKRVQNIEKFVTLY